VLIGTDAYVVRETAIRNANNLQKQAIDRGLVPADTNPGTTVHDLIIELRRIQK